MLDDRLAKQRVGKSDAKDDGEPCDARPAQGSSPFAAPAEEEGQQNDDAHGKHEQRRVVHRVLDEIGEESGFGRTQPPTDAAADKELLPENG